MLAHVPVGGRGQENLRLEAVEHLGLVVVSIEVHEMWNSAAQ